MVPQQKPEINLTLEQSNCINQGDNNSFDVFLNSIANSNVSTIERVNYQKSDAKLPEYLYHLTSKENALKILKSKKLVVPKTECRASKTYDSETQLRGIYTIDKDNFKGNWQKHDKYNVTAEVLKLIADSSNEVAIIKIPTSKLDKTKMKIRPIHEATTNPDYLKGFSIDELNSWKNSALEYVYQDDIPVDSFASVEYKNFNLPIVYDSKTKKELPDFSLIRKSPEKTRELMEILFPE